MVKQKLHQKTPTMDVAAGLQVITLMAFTERGIARGPPGPRGPPGLPGPSGSGGSGFATATIDYSALMKSKSMLFLLTDTKTIFYLENFSNLHAELIFFLISSTS